MRTDGSRPSSRGWASAARGGQGIYRAFEAPDILSHPARQRAPPNLGFLRAVLESICTIVYRLFQAQEEGRVVGLGLQLREHRPELVRLFARGFCTHDRRRSV